MNWIKKISCVALMVFCLFCVSCNTDYTEKVSNICQDNEWEYESIRFRSTNLPNIEYYGLHIQADGHNFEFFECDSKKNAKKLYDEFTEDKIAHPYISISKNNILVYDALIINGKPQELTTEDKTQIKDVFEKLKI